MRRWSMPIWRAARSTIWSASRSRLCCGASCRARVRRAACNRSRCASSATAKSRSRSFKPREYWSILATLATPRGGTFEARLVGADGQEDPAPRYRHRSRSRGASRPPSRRPIQGRPRSRPSSARRNPSPPFTTSTLQQEASRKLGFAPAHTMRLAQRLHEGIDIDGETVGLITYMRTDGVQIAPEAITNARAVIGEDYGKQYVPDAPRQYQTTRQERAGSPRSDPPDRSRRAVRPRSAEYVEAEQAKLYELIWIARWRARWNPPNSSAPRSRSPPRPARAPSICAPPVSVVKFDGFLDALSGRPGRRSRRRREPPPARDERQRDAEQERPQRDAAFHRAAAALLGSLARQAHGRTQHRPALDLRVDPAGAEGPRSMCASTRSA